MLLNTSIYATSNNQFLVPFPWPGLFPDNSLTVSKFPEISLTGFKFPDISRFSRQVVTLLELGLGLGLRLGLGVGLRSGLGLG